MGSSVNILIILVGVFLAAILANMYMLHEKFGSGSGSVDASGNQTDASGNHIGHDISHDASSNTDLDPSGNLVITSGNPDSSMSPGLEQGNTFSQLVKQLISGSSANLSAKFSANLNGNDKDLPYNKQKRLSENPLEESHLDSLGNPMDRNITKDVLYNRQSNDVLNYLLDPTAQQPTATTGPTADATTPFLQQGAGYSGNSGIDKASSAYAVGQQAARKAEPCPVDLNDYIRKDSIPCYACTLK